MYHYCIHSFLKLGTSNNESIGSKRIVQSTAKELCQGKETCGKRATFDVQRSVYHCSRRLAQSQRLIERMDKAVVRIETWTSFDLQNSENKSKFIEYLIIIDFAKIYIAYCLFIKIDSQVMMSLFWNYRAVIGLVLSSSQHVSLSNGPRRKMDFVSSCFIRWIKVFGQLGALKGKPWGLLYSHFLHHI